VNGSLGGVSTAEIRRTSVVPFVAYVVIFHAVWIAWPFLVYPRLVSALDDRTLAYALANLSIRFAVWVAPVWLYLRYVDGVDPVAYLKLKEFAGRGIAVALVLTALNAIGTYARFGAPHLTADRLTWNSVLGTSFLIGVIEEIPYRGFMLQKLSERVDFWIANLVTSVLFLAIHLPGWIALHTFNTPTAVTIFVFGFVMGVVLKYTQSLWAPILTHSANDCLSFVVWGH